MTRFIRILSTYPLLGSAFALLALLGCKEEAPPKKTLVRPAKIMEIKTGGAGWKREFPARVQASEQADLAFNINGTLKQILVKEGKEVKKGDVLAKIDSRDLQNQLNAKRARLESAKSDFLRHQTLFNENVTTKADLERRERQYKVELAELKIAEKALADSVLKAPFAGRITRRHVDNFEEVQAKQPILSLQNLNELVLKVDVPEDIMAPIKKRGKMKAMAKFASLPDKEFRLGLKEYASQADEQTQTYEVSLIMPAVESVQILPGMTATVTAEAEPIADDNGEIQVPVAAVAADTSGKHFVWRVDKSMKVKKTPVDVEGLTGETMVVTKGLKNGDRIVVAGVNELEENQQIRELVVKEEKDQ